MVDTDGNLIIGSSGSGGGTDPTGLEALDQGNGVGWRLIGRDDIHYAPIGQHAVDVSFNDAGATIGAGGTASFTAGYSTYTGNYAAAFGHTSWATGDYSFSAGRNATASGPQSFAMGYGNEASGSNSFAIGEETLASGEFSVAMGDRSQATEQGATAIGTATLASGTHSLATGNSTVATGSAATAMGFVTNAQSFASLAIGRNNIGGGDAYVWNETDPLFEVGNGTETTASNAFTVLKNGKVGIGTNQPGTALHISGNDPNPFRIQTATNGNWTSFFTSNGYKGYLGVYNGNDDMDFGTGAGNTNGKVHLVTNASPKLSVAANGNVGIGTTNPSEKLEVQGDIKTTGEIHSTNTGAANLVPIAYGRVAGDGTIESGTDNFSASRADIGNFSIDLVGETENDHFVIVANAITSVPVICSVGYFPTFPGRFSIGLWNFRGDRLDSRFSFVVYRR
jgi:hypothetical protein